MLHSSFNQDSTCIAIGHENGFIIYNCDPARERFSRLVNSTTEPNGIGIIGMLYKSNIFALVGGGKNPKFPLNKVSIWDDTKNQVLFDFTTESHVTNVKLKKDLLVITSINTTFVYNLSNPPVLLISFPTIDNHHGIIALSFGTNNIMSTLTNIVGQVSIDHISNKISTARIDPLFIKAHNDPIRFIAISFKGDQIATCSNKGTIIRVWNAITGTLIKELRRGIDTANINCIAFNNNGDKLVVSSNKDTIHLFFIGTQEKNKESILSNYKSILPEYFSSEWSTITFTAPPNSNCTFSSDSNLMYVLTPTNMLIKYSINYEQKFVKNIESIRLIL